MMSTDSCYNREGSSLFDIKFFPNVNIYFGLTYMLKFDSHLQGSSLPLIALIKIWKVGVSRHGNGISTRILNRHIWYTLAGTYPIGRNDWVRLTPLSCDHNSLVYFQEELTF